MNGLTPFGAAAVMVMMLSHALEERSDRWVLIAQVGFTPPAGAAC